ncbi:MAG: VirE protein [Prevotella sp.]|nr:VirE protein [Prevotella sp.]
MYRFSFTESVAGKAQEVSRQLFYEIISRKDIKEKCKLIAEGKIELKRKLPAFCWHAWFDEGKRKNYCAHPSGLIMIDVDHVEEPRQLYASIEKKAKEMGLLVAHVTPSTKGLRLVFPVPQGMDIVKAQSYYAHALNLQVDACTKDLARLSFAVPEEYWLWIDEKIWTAHPSLPDREGVQTANKQEEGTEENSSLNNSSLPEGQPIQHSTFQIPNFFNGIPYSTIVSCLEERLGGKPAHGSRNNFIFSMAAYLRYICDDDPNWIAQILPTYGEAHDKWRRTIDSACQRAQYKVMPNVVKDAIAMARHKQENENEDENQNTLPPAMPKKLPFLIQHLTKNVPEVCRPAVANGVFPALAAHLHGVKFWLIDGTEKEATFMCVNMAAQSSGKSAVNKPIEYILADIVERDEINRKREQEWKDSTQTKGANKEKPKRPDDLCVQVLVSDMTNAAFVQRMKDAGEHYLYTNLEELDLLKQLQTNGTKDVGKIICLCFDNGKYGQERVGTQSVTARVNLRWNWNASSTIQKGINFFKGRLVDGTLSRINFCTIIKDKSIPFVYGKYDEKYAEKLKPYIANLNLATGHIECKQALALAQRLSNQCAEEAALSDDEIYQELSYRAVTIAYLKAMVLYIANDMTWSKEIEEFTEWSLKYDLWCKMHFFGSKIAEDKEKENVKGLRGRKNLLDLLPNPFTTKDANELRQTEGLPERGCGQMIRQWIYRGYIERDCVPDVYLKTQEYINRA